MNRAVDRLKLFFLGLFALACGGIWAYQAIYVWPAERCEAAGNWWDPQGRECATPIDLRAFPRVAPAPEGARNPPTPEALANPNYAPVEPGAAPQTPASPPAAAPMSKAPPAAAAPAAK